MTKLPGYGLQHRAVVVLFPVAATRFVFFEAYRPVQWLTQLSIQCVTGTFSPGTKWPGREANYSPLSSCWVYKNVTSTSPIRLRHFHIGSTSVWIWSVCGISDCAGDWIRSSMFWDVTKSISVVTDVSVQLNRFHLQGSSTWQCLFCTWVLFVFI